MDTRLEYIARASDGADLLDVHGPDGWRDKIDLSALDMKDVRFCVLGQVYGTYYIGLNDLNLNDDATPDYGFNLPFPALIREEEWRMLTEAWRQVLSKAV